LKVALWFQATIAVTLGGSLKVSAMAGFAKFNPRAFLEREKRAAANAGLAKNLEDISHPANKLKTLAGLATLAAQSPQNENQEIGYPDTTADHHPHGKNQPNPAKVAKVAKVESPVATIEGAAWGDAEEERAAIVEHDGGAPLAWAEALARLDPAKPPSDVPLKRWVQFIDDCGRFLDDGWANCAEALGWGPLDLFGCDRIRPFARIDRAGLLWLLNGQKLLVLAADAAAIATASGGSLTYHRRPVEVGRVVLAWEIAKAEK
jgi:hypothetical protein